MTNEATQVLRNRAARIAGLSYLFMVVGGLAYWYMVAAPLTVPESARATAANVLAHEGLFRAGIGYEIFMVMNLIAAAAALHAVLEPVNRRLAWLGRCWILIEASMAAMMALLGFVGLQVLTASGTLTAFAPAQLNDLVGIYLNVRMAGHTISAVFMNLGMMVFMYLFFRSRLIPAWLAAFGVVSYGLMFVGVIVNVIVSGAPVFMAMQSPFDVICLVPSILSEIVAGSWLLWRGVDLERAAANSIAA